MTLECVRNDKMIDKVIGADQANCHWSEPRLLQRHRALLAAGSPSLFGNRTSY